MDLAVEDECRLRSPRSLARAHRTSRSSSLPPGGSRQAASVNVESYQIGQALSPDASPSAGEESQADSDIVSPGEGERIKPPPTPKAHASFDAAYCPVACLLADAGLDAAVTTERSEDISLMAVSSSSEGVLIPQPPSPTAVPEGVCPSAGVGSGLPPSLLDMSPALTDDNTSQVGERDARRQRSKRFSSPTGTQLAHRKWNTESNLRIIDDDEHPSQERPQEQRPSQGRPQEQRPPASGLLMSAQTGQPAKGRGSAARICSMASSLANPSKQGTRHLQQHLKAVMPNASSFQAEIDAAKLASCATAALEKSPVRALSTALSVAELDAREQFDLEVALQRSLLADNLSQSVAAPALPSTEAQLSCSLAPEPTSRVRILVVGSTPFHFTWPEVERVLLERIQQRVPLLASDEDMPYAPLIHFIDEGVHTASKYRGNFPTDVHPAQRYEYIIFAGVNVITRTVDDQIGNDLLKAIGPFLANETQGAPKPAVIFLQPRAWVLRSIKSEYVKNPIYSLPLPGSSNCCISPSLFAFNPFDTARDYSYAIDPFLDAFELSTEFNTLLFVRRSRRLRSTYGAAKDIAKPPSVPDETLPTLRTSCLPPPSPNGGVQPMSLQENAVNGISPATAVESTTMVKRPRKALLPGLTRRQSILRSSYQEFHRLSEALVNNSRSAREAAALEWLEEAEERAFHYTRAASGLSRIAQRLHKIHCAGIARHSLTTELGLVKRLRGYFLKYVALQFPSADSEMQQVIAKRDAPHGSHGSTLKPVSSPSERVCSVDTILEDGLADKGNALPLIGQPSRFKNEITMPVGSSFIWKPYAVVIFGEHTGVLREVAAKLLAPHGLFCASIADRRTMIQPSDNADHIIDDFHSWFRSYPHAILLAICHPNCGTLNKASHAARVRKLIAGEVREAVEEALWCQRVARFSALEQAPSDLEDIIGVPDMKVNFMHFGDKYSKDWWIWLRCLPQVLPTHDIDPAERQIFVSTASSGSKEKLTLMRAPSSPFIARALLAPWIEYALQHQNQPFMSSEERAQRRDIAMHRLSTFAARFAPTATWSQLELSAHVIIVPICFHGAYFAQIPLHAAAFAVPVSTNPDADAASIAQSLCSDFEPLLTGYTKDASAHSVYVLPVKLNPVVELTISNESELVAARTSKAAAEWARPTALLQDPCYTITAMAVSRLNADREHSLDSGLRVGMWSDARALVPFRASRAWQLQAASTESDSEYALFRTDERARGEAIRTAFVAADCGDGRMAAWAARCTTAADLHDLPQPQQGMPKLRVDIVQSLPSPMPPPPCCTEFLHTLPPQRVPPGCPVRVHVHAMIAAWGRRIIAATLNNLAAACLSCWHSGCQPVGSRSTSITLGAQVFGSHPHADGIGHFSFSCAFWELDPEDSYYYQLIDFNKKYQEHKDLEMIRRIFTNDGACECSDQELMAMLFEGTRYKVTPPRQIRIAKQLLSLDSRIQQVAETYKKLWQAGLHHVQKLACLSQSAPGDVYFTADGPGMVSIVPGISSAVGGADKKDAPNEKRPVSNQSEPHTIKFARTRPHGPPDGEVVHSINDMTGSKRKPLPLQPSTEPEARSIRFNAPLRVDAHEYLIDISKNMRADAGSPFQAHPRELDAYIALLTRPVAQAQQIAREFGVTMLAAYADDAADERRSDAIREAVLRHLQGRRLIVWDGAASESAELQEPITPKADTWILTPDGSGGDIHLARSIAQALAITIARRSTRSYLETLPPHPFPDLERKTSPRRLYQANAILMHMACSADSCVVAFQDDVRWAFFQFWLAIEQRCTSMVYLILDIEGELWFCCITRLCMDMGVRPASQICCRFTEGLLAYWRWRMDTVIVPAWLASQPQQLQALLATRSAELGAAHARPYFADVFTDDYIFLIVSPTLAALGAREWIAITGDAKIWMAADHKKGLGTVPIFIGGRLVVNGGFGTLPFTKRMKAVSEIDSAIALPVSDCTREKYKSTISYLTHCAEWLAFEDGTLKGISGPLRNPGFDELPVILTKNARFALLSARRQLLDRPAGAFMSAIMDAPSPASFALISSAHSASDACTDAEHPAIFLIFYGIAFLFELDDAWLEKHITVLERAGHDLQVIEFGKLLDDHVRHVVQCDASAAIHSALWQSRSDDMIYMRQRFERCPTARRRVAATWTCHLGGHLNTYADLGSRGRFTELRMLCSLMGIRLELRTLSLESIEYLQDVVVHTSNYELVHPDPPRFHCNQCSQRLTAIQHHCLSCPRCNAAVRAASRHATSVHLGVAADSSSQADHRMADMEPNPHNTRRHHQPPPSSPPPDPSNTVVVSGPPSSTPQFLAMQWCMQHRSQLMPRSQPLLPEASYFGYLDLRLPANMSISSVQPGDSERGPCWFGSSSLTTSDRAHMLRAVLTGWSFPAEFIALQHRDLVAQSLPGQPLHGRNVLIVACGDDLSVESPTFCQSMFMWGLRPAPPPVTQPNSTGNDGVMRSNAIVQAASRHATSVHLGTAADSSAQADHRMADMEQSSGLVQSARLHSRTFKRNAAAGFTERHGKGIDRNYIRSLATASQPTPAVRSTATLHAEHAQGGTPAAGATPYAVTSPPLSVPANQPVSITRLWQVWIDTNGLSLSAATAWRDAFQAHVQGELCITHPAQERRFNALLQSLGWQPKAPSRKAVTAVMMEAAEPARTLLSLGDTKLALENAPVGSLHAPYHTLTGVSQGAFEKWRRELAPYVAATRWNKTSAPLAATRSAVVTSNEAVSAASRHASSVHLGVAADSSSQADHRMADMDSPSAEALRQRLPPCHRSASSNGLSSQLQRSLAHAATSMAVADSAATLRHDALTQVQQAVSAFLATPSVTTQAAHVRSSVAAQPLQPPPPQRSSASRRLFHPTTPLSGGLASAPSSMARDILGLQQQVRSLLRDNAELRQCRQRDHTHCETAIQQCHNMQQQMLLNFRFSASSQNHAVGSTASAARPPTEPSRHQQRSRPQPLQPSARASRHIAKRRSRFLRMRGGGDDTLAPLWQLLMSRGPLEIHSAALVIQRQARQLFESTWFLTESRLQRQRLSTKCQRAAIVIQGQVYWWLASIRIFNEERSARIIHYLPLATHGWALHLPLLRSWAEKLAVEIVKDKRWWAEQAERDLESDVQWWDKHIDMVLTGDKLWWLEQAEQEAASEDQWWDLHANFATARDESWVSEQKTFAAEVRRHRWNDSMHLSISEARQWWDRQKATALSASLQHWQMQIMLAIATAEHSWAKKAATAVKAADHAAVVIQRHVRQKREVVAGPFPLLPLLLRLQPDDQRDGTIQAMGRWTSFDPPRVFAPPLIALVARLYTQLAHATNTIARLQAELSTTRVSLDQLEAEHAGMVVDLNMALSRASRVTHDAIVARSRAARAAMRRYQTESTSGPASFPQQQAGASSSTDAPSSAVMDSDADLAKALQQIYDSMPEPAQQVDHASSIAGFSSSSGSANSVPEEDSSSVESEPAATASMVAPSPSPVIRLPPSHQPEDTFQIFYRAVNGHHGSLDSVSATDLASEICERIAIKQGMRASVARGFRLLLAGKCIDGNSACGLRSGDTVHLVWALNGGMWQPEEDAADDGVAWQPFGSPALSSTRSYDDDASATPSDSTASRDSVESCFQLSAVSGAYSYSPSLSSIHPPGPASSASSSYDPTPAPSPHFSIASDDTDHAFEGFIAEDTAADSEPFEDFHSFPSLYWHWLKEDEGVYVWRSDTTEGVWEFARVTNIESSIDDLIGLGHHHWALGAPPAGFIPSAYWKARQRGADGKPAWCRVSLTVRTITPHRRCLEPYEVFIQNDPDALYSMASVAGSNDGSTSQPWRIRRATRFYVRMFAPPSAVGLRLPHWPAPSTQALARRLAAEDAEEGFWDVLFQYDEPDKPRWYLDTSNISATMASSLVPLERRTRRWEHYNQSMWPQDWSPSPHCAGETCRSTTDVGDWCGACWCAWYDESCCDHLTCLRWNPPPVSSALQTPRGYPGAVRKRRLGQKDAAPQQPAWCVACQLRHLHDAAVEPVHASTNLAPEVGDEDAACQICDVAPSDDSPAASPLSSAAAVHDEDEARQICEVARSIDSPRASPLCSALATTAPPEYDAPFRRAAMLLLFSQDYNVGPVVVQLSAHKYGTPWPQYPGRPTRPRPPCFVQRLIKRSLQSNPDPDYGNIMMLREFFNHPMNNQEHVDHCYDEFVINADRRESEVFITWHSAWLGHALGFPPPPGHQRTICRYCGYAYKFHFAGPCPHCTYTWQGVQLCCSATSDGTPSWQRTCHPTSPPSFPTSNAAVDAASRHKTSTHLGLAADSVAQQDYRMADMEALGLDDGHSPCNAEGSSAPDAPSFHFSLPREASDSVADLASWMRPCAVKLLLLVSGPGGESRCLSGIRRDARNQTLVNVDIIGGMVPDGVMPSAQLLHEVLEEMPRAPLPFFAALNAMLAQAPLGHQAFYFHGDGHRVLAHHVYVYYIDVTAMLNAHIITATPTAWLDPHRPADNEWVIGSAAMRSLEDFAEAEAISYHAWRAAYLNGIIGVWRSITPPQLNPQLPPPPPPGHAPAALITAELCEYAYRGGLPPGGIPVQCYHSTSRPSVTEAAGNVQQLALSTASPFQAVVVADDILDSPPLAWLRMHVEGHRFLTRLMFYLYASVIFAAEAQPGQAGQGLRALAQRMLGASKTYVPRQLTQQYDARQRDKGGPMLPTVVNNPEWARLSITVLEAAAQMQLRQQPEMVKTLVQTGNSVLAAAFDDSSLGIGVFEPRAFRTHRRHWGANLDGRALMRQRHQLAEQEDANSGRPAALTSPPPPQLPPTPAPPPTSHVASNASVDATSRHATSVHLGLAADASSQPDYSMADMNVRPEPPELIQPSTPTPPAPSRTSTFARARSPPPFDLAPTPPPHHHHAPERHARRASASLPSPLRLPQTPAAARAAAAEQLASELVEDDSAFALFPDQPERVRELCHDVHNARAAGIPKGTDQATSNGWKWALTFCVSTGMSIMRPRALVTNLEHLREAYFFAALFMFIACNIAPRTSRSAAAPAQGKPQSALNAVYGYRRALSMCSCQLVDMRMISSILKGLNAQFKATWGKDALVPEHRRAFSLAQLRAMVRLLDTRAIFSWSDDMHVALRSAYLYGLHTGARLNEMVEPASYKRRSEIEMVDGGQVIPATPENIARFSNGMLLRIRPDCSKADRFNISWGNREMHFAMDDTNVLNFPAAWKRFELQFPCALEERASLAAFSPHGSRSPFAEHELRSAFILLMVTAFGATVAAVHSWHALRVTLACALLAGGQCDGTIQAVCRWKSIDSLRIYAEMTASTYASTAALVTTTDASKYATSALPTTGPEDVAADIDDAITLINGDAPPRARAASAPARSSSPPPPTDATPPPPSTATQLRKGARVSVYWTEEGAWYSGTVTSSRKADETRITRVLYDAAPPHKAHAAWHNLDEERWALL